MLRSLLLGTVLALVLAAPGWAGGGPETTLVVVNAADPASVRVANAYARGRDIPASHVLYLEDVPATPTIGVDAFRERILEPIERYLEAEGLQDDVDLIAYSVGFPYGVSFDADAKAAAFEVRAPISRMASLTGLTYLYRHVLAKDPAAYLSLTANRYFRRDLQSVPEGVEAFGPEDAARVRTYRGALASKDWRQAATVLEDLLGDFPAVSNFWYDLACCRALLGDDDAAMEALEKAVEHGFREAEHAERDPDLEGLRKRPRFGELLDAMRAARREIEVAPTLAFEARKAWDEAGRPVDAPSSPHRYRLAVMLGWTGEHGNTTDEVLQVLERAREGDGTFPDGTVYFMKNGDVRSRTRAPWFAAVQAALARLGRKAEILDNSQPGQDGRLPRGKFDAIGIVAGSAGLAWRDTDRPLLPGGIGEHLTSFGAHFGTASQTKCTEFFRHGAAGTSGTVAEPYAIPHKFPSPWMHVHYARGCSLAEAFYQSVNGPYQLLVLGDGLAHPFAKGVDVAIVAPEAGATVQGEVAVDATFDLPTGVTLDHKELWVDGRKVRVGPPEDMLSWNANDADAGAHEIRVVAVESGPIATRSSASVWVEVEAADERRLEAEAPRAVVLGEILEVAGKAKGIEAVTLRRGSQVLATAPVKHGRFALEVAAMRLGLGTTQLQVFGRGEKDGARTAPFPVAVTGPTELLVGRIVRDGDALPGLRARWQDEEGQEHEGIVATLAGPGGRESLAADLRAAGATGTAVYRLDGVLRAPEGLATFAITAAEPPRIRIGGHEVETAALADGRWSAFAPLAAGWHEVEIELAGDPQRLGVAMGGVRPAAPLADGDLAHVPEAWARAANPASIRLGEDGPPEMKLWDGKRHGEAVTVDGERGLVAGWEERQKDVLAVVLYAETGKDAKPLGPAWIVETRTSDRGHWREVKDLEIVPGPRYVVLRFKRTSARGVRVRPREGASAVAEVEVFARARR